MSPTEGPNFTTDLHAHTRFSDGVLTPAELVERALGRGVERLAITDHDTCGGLEAARLAAEGQPIEIIPGIELSVWHNKDLHLLGYFVDPSAPDLSRCIEGLSLQRVSRAREIAERLDVQGKPIDIDALIETVGAGNIGRPHIAQAMLEAGHVRHINEAFRKYLGTSGSAFVSASRIPAEDAIEAIHRAGGVAVLAHPAIDGAESVLESLRDRGLDGVEIEHPGHKAGARRRLRRLASRLDLVPTGGSDFHGPGAVDLGDFGVGDALIARLEARSASGQA